MPWDGGGAAQRGADPAERRSDLKSLNLLIDRYWRLKISDLGLSRLRPSSSAGRHLTGNVGTPHWMAVEVIGNQNYSESADVYSFGMCLWELVTRRPPFEGMAPMQVLVAVFSLGQRPAIPDDPQLPAGYANLVRRCWAQDPSARPTMDEVRGRADGG